MFASMFSALKRIWDLTSGPMLVGLVLTGIEWFFGAIEWTMVALSQAFTMILVGLLNLLPLPEGFDPHQFFNSELIRLADALNIFLALQIWFTARLAAFVVKILTVGIVRK